MKTYKYYDPWSPEEGYIYTEEQILKEYWSYWEKAMIKVGRTDLISEENCITDWCVVNWAQEIKDEERRPSGN